jgi:hypothetical protein
VTNGLGLAVGGGCKVDGRKHNMPPTKRHGAPTVSVIAMQDVPEPPAGRGGSIGEELYRKVKALQTGQAVKADFETEKHGEYVRTKMRSLAKKDKLFLSSSRSTDGRTRYFWLEKL